MIKFELTEAQKQNLLVFLNRVQLTGNEVPLFIDIMDAIGKGINYPNRVQSLKKEAE